MSVVQQPAIQPFGSPVAVAVQVKDQYGALLQNAFVKLFLGTNPNPGVAVLSGATATSNADGLATFPSLTVSAAGEGYTIVATSGQALPAVSSAFNVGKRAASVFLSGLAHTYDGLPKSATVTTVPSGLATAVTYNGNTALPTAAGSYAVVATVTDPNYSGSATGTLTINKASATVAVSSPTYTYDGTAKSAPVTTNPGGLVTAVMYNGNIALPIAVGSYAVVATIIDPNYAGGAIGTLTITNAVDIAMPSQAARTAQSGVQYALPLTASGGTSPYSWSLVSGGGLPAGLSLNVATGVISGTATTTGAFTFTVRAQDAVGASNTLTLCITVVSPPATNLAATAVGQGGVTMTSLVTSLLGQGVLVSNVVLTGANAGAGVFEGGASILGFATGIVLSSGNVNDAKGPNNSDSTTTSRGEPGDPDLTTLAGQATNDATVIEFDFVPTGNQVSFRYVFGSEEYNEFVASQYNDVFGFFITGPDGIKRNWALVPGTNQPVTINSINGGNAISGAIASNPTLYRNNDLSDVTPTINIQADGLTVVLTLTATVTPGASHHMKLAIADAGDSSYDSWVFIEGSSFHAVENCTNGIDDDGDGLVDGADPDCQACPVLPSVGGLDDATGADAGLASVDVVDFTVASTCQARLNAVPAIGGETTGLVVVRRNVEEGLAAGRWRPRNG